MSLCLNPRACAHLILMLFAFFQVKISNSVFWLCSGTSVVETLESQSEQLKTSYTELQLVLTSERQHSAELVCQLAAERQTAASAHDQCNVLSERLSNMQKTLVDTENHLQAVLYAVLYFTHFIALTLEYYLCNCIFSMTTWVNWHQKGKPFWILIKQEMMG